MKHKKSVLMTLNHNYGCFSGVCSGIAGNVPVLGAVRAKNAPTFEKRLDNHRAQGSLFDPKELVQSQILI